MSEYSEWMRRDIPNRNRHILFNLLKNDQVEKILAVDFMPFTFKRSARIYKDNFIADFGVKTLRRNLTSKLTKISDKLYVHSTIKTAFDDEDGAYNKIDKDLAILGMNKYILWSYYPMFSGYFDHFKTATASVFDAVDNWMEHPNFEAHYRDRLRKNYEVIDKKASPIFTVSKDLLDIFPENKNKHWIPNGVDCYHFLHGKSGAISKKVSELKRPIIGYIGIIQERLDFELISILAKNNPDKSFVLGGPVWKGVDLSNLEKLPNIYFPGKVNYNESPKVMAEFDVGIIPHRVNKFTSSMNPLKLYEYLAVGLPVVTTPVAGTEEFAGHVKQASTPKEFQSAIEEALSQGKKKELVEERKKIAKKNSWRQKVGEMLRLIQSK